METVETLQLIPPKLLTLSAHKLFFALTNDKVSTVFQKMEGMCPSTGTNHAKLFSEH